MQGELESPDPGLRGQTSSRFQGQGRKAPCKGWLKVLAYSLTFGCFGAEVLLFGYLCSAPVFAQQCCVTGRERTRALESMAVRRVSAPPHISHGTLGGGTESGLRCPLPPPHKLCGKGGDVGEEPGTRWHVGGSP